MLLEISAFLLRALAYAIGCLLKFTGNVYPQGVQWRLLKVVVRSWQASLPQRLGFYNLFEPKTFDEAGLLPSPQDVALEEPVELESEDDVDDLLFYGVDEKGNALVVNIRRHGGNHAEGNVHVKIGDSMYSATCSGTSLNEFAVGTLKFEGAEAMRKWRLWYNGVATEVGHGGKQAHLIVNSLWKPLEEPYDHQKNANADLISKELALNGDFESGFTELESKIPKGYTQFGTLHCWIQANGSEKLELCLNGFRKRRQFNLKTLLKGPSQDAVELFGFNGSDGNSFLLNGAGEMWTHGETHHVSSTVRPFSRITVVPADFHTNQRIPKSFNFIDSTATHQVEIRPQLSTSTSNSLELVVLKLEINAMQANGILLRHKYVRPAIKSSVVASNIACGHDFVPIDSPVCQNVKLVGGKGASLASLESFIRDKQLGDEYKTSPGFCVTTNFFRRIVKLDHIRTILNAARNDTELADACSRVQKLIIESKVEETVEPQVEVWMKKIFGQVKSGGLDRNLVERFAVRSSGTLEDGADVSCAGQNETYLGVKEEQVPAKVLECWASLFTFQSVRYRLNHGQPAVSDMGVVVQAMVNATAAGVIFTADPITGNPFELLINANYGLGESVVSATCDPDTIKVERNKQEPSTLNVSCKTVGKKMSKIVMNDIREGSTKEVTLSDDEAQQCCISDDVAVKLAAIALQLVEANDGRPVDIEWAVDGSSIYILQSRNITSLDLWTDEEIIHECDTAIKTQFERFTTANTGEVAPGACSPLGISFMMKHLDHVFQARTAKRYGCDPTPSCGQVMAFTSYRLMISILDTLYRTVDKEIESSLVGLDFSVFGHRVIDEELHRLAVARWGVASGAKKMNALVRLIKYISRNNKMVESVKRNLSKYSFKLDDVKEDYTALWQRITDELPKLTEAIRCHGDTTECSSGMQIITLSIISQGKKADEWDSKVYNDVSKMLSVCTQFESTDIPGAMEKLAQAVIDEGEKVTEEFISLDSNVAVELFTTNPRLKQAYDEFMDKHGHRGIFEMDMLRQSWKTDPAPFVRLVQSIVSSKSKFKDYEKSAPKTQYSSDDELIQSLENPITNKTVQRLLKFMLPYCRSTVVNREKSKSLVVRTCNEFRKAFRVLGQLLAEHGLIPDKDLIYFLTMDELRQIVQLKHTSARILFKAGRRRKLHPELDKAEYPEISIGIPRPIVEAEELEFTDSIKGTPVSSGKVRGIVKVCHSVDDAAALIQPGDIMVAHSTDVGWSPFFPILGGVVTELGGLISHGAVVAREYGLPCLVGAANASKVFKSGEEVVLDATNGVMYKVNAAK